MDNTLKGNTRRMEMSLDSSHVYDQEFLTHLASTVERCKLTHMIFEWQSFFYSERRTKIVSYLIDATDDVGQFPKMRGVVISASANLYIGEIASCMQHLQSLEVRGVFVPGNIEHLCEGLQRTSTLTILTLKDCMIVSTDDFRLLSQALANNSSVTTLCIEHCHMNNESVKAFLQHWRQDSQIRNLAFIHANIRAEGAMLLIQAASGHPAMESLSISENQHIGYDGLANIATDLPNVVLKSLNMSSCARAETEDPNWLETVVVVGGLIAEGVKANTHLVEIDVSGTNFDADTGRVVETALAFYTLRNKYAPLMMVSELQLQASVWCHCFAKHGRNASFIFHFLQDQPLLWQDCRKDNKASDASPTRHASEQCFLF